MRLASSRPRAPKTIAAARVVALRGAQVAPRLAVAAALVAVPVVVASIVARRARIVLPTPQPPARG